MTTNKGLDLISRSNATGKGILYTHVALGDGELGSKNIADLTNLISTKMSKLPVTNTIDHENGHYEIEAEVNNENLNTGFWAREMGVFAKCEGDSDSAIVLFAYTNGGNYVPYVNDKSRPDIQLCQLDVITGNATELNALIDPRTYVTNARLTTILKDYVPFVGGKMTGNLEVINQTLTSNNFSAANTSFVQSLIQSYLTMGATNFAAFKQSVANTFEQDTRNQNSWWIKLPSGVIIQGINHVPTGEETTVQYPITISRLLGVIGLTHDYYNANTVRTVERITRRKNGTSPNDLTEICYRKVTALDQRPMVVGGVHFFVIGL